MLQGDGSLAPALAVHAQPLCMQACAIQAAVAAGLCAAPGVAALVHNAPSGGHVCTCCPVRRRVLQAPDMELIMRYRELPCPGCGGMEE